MIMVKDCYNCEHHIWGDEWWNCKTECHKCRYTDRQGEKVPSNWKPLPMTNADRIRAMSDDELAKVLNAFTDYFEECNRSSSDVDCKDCELYKVCSLHEGKALEWLKQPAEVE
jgi:hypothetical protein